MNKRNWLPIVLITAAAAAGLICRSAHADNKGFKFSGGSSRNFQMSGGSGQSNVVRSLRSQSLGTSGALGSSLGGMKTQIKPLNGNLGLGISQNTQILNNAGRLNGAVLGTQVLNKPAVITKIGNVNGILKSQGSQTLNSQLLNSNAAKQLAHTILGNQKCVIDPGFGKGCSPCWNPIKIGCQPWWWGHYSWCYPNYNPVYPIVYTQPIVVPVSVPVVTEVVTAGAVVEEKLLQVPAGATLTLQALDLGLAAGQVVLQLNQMAMPAMVNEWKNDAVTATLSPMGLSSPIKGEITIVKADGKVASSIKVEVIPAQPQSNTGAAAGAAAAQ